MKSPKISMIRAALLTSIAVSGLAVTAPVMAQEAAASADNIDEIIVTARRREENLLDVRRILKNSNANNSKNKFY